MSNPLPGNPYQADNGLTETADGLQITKALQALAYEQRTANLIALASTPGVGMEGKTTALNQVQTRLGMHNEERA